MISRVMSVLRKKAKALGLSILVTEPGHYSVWTGPRATGKRIFVGSTKGQLLSFLHKYTEKEIQHD